MEVFEHFGILVPMGKLEGLATVLTYFGIEIDTKAVCQQQNW